MTEINSDVTNDETNEEASDTTSSKELSTEDVYERLNVFCRGFSSLLHVDTTNQISELDQLVDGILAKLEEICNVVESVRHESKDVIFTTIPLLHEKCNDIKPIFKQIDRLELFISMVNDCMMDAEEKVSIAEKEFGGKNFKTFLKNVPKFLGGSSKDTQQRNMNILQSPPKSFKTDDFFGPNASKDTIHDHQ